MGPRSRDGWGKWCFLLIQSIFKNLPDGKVRSLGTRRDFLWTGKLFADYLDMFQWENVPSDVTYSMTAVPESCQFKLRVRENIYTKHPLVRANRGSSDQVEFSVTTNFFIGTCLNSPQITSKATRSLPAYLMDLKLHLVCPIKSAFFIRRSTDLPSPARSGSHLLQSQSRKWCFVCGVIWFVKSQILNSGCLAHIF